MTRRRAVRLIKSPVTWILVADSKQAQVYTRRRMEKRIPLANNSRRNQFEEVIASEPVPVNGMKWQAESAAEYDVHRNQLGRVQESANAAHHMSVPRLDVHEEIRDHFARMISEQLNQAREAKSFDRLVLIAPARMLGELKKHLGEKLQKSIAAEMSKDLTHYDCRALAEHLDGIA